MIIQTNGEFKKYEPCDLPDGCIVSGELEGLEGYRYYGKIVDGEIRYMSTENGTYPHPVPKRHSLKDLINIKLIAIVDENVNSTHVKRWMATDDEGCGIWYKKPMRLSGCKQYDSLHHYRSLEQNICNQTWQDEPWEVWEEV